jgi:hypothetical protein
MLDLSEFIWLFVRIKDKRSSIYLEHDNNNFWHSDKIDIYNSSWPHPQPSPKLLSSLSNPIQVKEPTKTPFKAFSNKCPKLLSSLSNPIQVKEPTKTPFKAFSNKCPNSRLRWSFLATVQIFHKQSFFRSWMKSISTITCSSKWTICIQRECSLLPT